MTATKTVATTKAPITTTKCISRDDHLKIKYKLTKEINKTNQKNKGIDGIKSLTENFFCWANDLYTELRYSQKH